jgi:hypothetical protein
MLKNNNYSRGIEPSRHHSPHVFVVFNGQTGAVISTWKGGIKQSIVISVDALVLSDTWHCDSMHSNGVKITESMNQHGNATYEIAWSHFVPKMAVLSP